MKRIILYTICMVLLVGFVYAFETFYDHSGETWNMWGRHYEGYNAQDGLLVSGNWHNISNYITQSIANYGTGYQPLVEDLENQPSATKLNHLIIIDSSYVLVYNVTENGNNLLVQRDSGGIGGQYAVMMAYTNFTGTENDRPHIIYHNVSDLIILRYNNTQLYLVYNISFVDKYNSTLQGAGIKCFRDNTYDIDSCLIRTYRFRNNSDAHLNDITKRKDAHISIVYKSKFDSSDNFQVFRRQILNGLNTTADIIFNYDDYDDDTRVEAIAWYDNDNDNDFGYGIFDTYDGSLETHKDNILTVPQCYRYRESSECMFGAGSDFCEGNLSYNFSTPIFLDVNGGQSEIVILDIYRAGVNNIKIIPMVYDSSGVQLWNYELPPRSGYQHSYCVHSSNFVISDCDADGYDDVIIAYGSGSGGGDTIRNIYCLDGDDGSVIYGFNHTETPTIFYPDNVSFQIETITAGRLGCSVYTGCSTDVYDEVVIGGGFIVDLYDNSLYSNNLGAPNSYGIIADIDSDNFYDIIFSNRSQTNIYFNNYTNVYATINDVSWDTCSPICYNSEVIFTVSNYSDIESNSIRMKIDCLGDGSYTDWSSSSFTPIASCNFTSLGTFNPIVAITDQSGLSVTDTLTINTANCGMSFEIKLDGCYYSGETDDYCQRSCSVSGLSAVDVIKTNVTPLIDVSGTDDIAQYTSDFFDYNQCGFFNTGVWEIFNMLCPPWIILKTLVSDILNWMWSNFRLFLGIFFVGIVIVFIIKKVGSQYPHH